MSSSNVIWLADTNYRIDLGNDDVRSLAEQGEYDALVAVDQVCCKFFFHRPTMRHNFVFCNSSSKSLTIVEHLWDMRKAHCCSHPHINMMSGRIIMIPARRREYQLGLVGSTM